MVGPLGRPAEMKLVRLPKDGAELGLSFVLLSLPRSDTSRTALLGSHLLRELVESDGDSVFARCVEGADRQGRSGQLGLRWVEGRIVGLDEGDSAFHCGGMLLLLGEG